jgi:succinate dehydrogenase / fumarate reductase cytochrome b subunit
MTSAREAFPQGLRLAGGPGTGSGATGLKRSWVRADTKSMSGSADTVVVRPGDGAPAAAGAGSLPGVWVSAWRLMKFAVAVALLPACAGLTLAFREYFWGYDTQARVAVVGWPVLLKWFLVGVAGFGALAILLWRPVVLYVFGHELMHAHTGLLWMARTVMLAAVALHVWSSFLLWLDKRRARPIGYVKKDDVPASYASRTMMWSGPIMGAFVVFHILHLTAGGVPGLALREPVEGRYFAYQNVVAGFQHPVVALAYVVAIVLLTMHLYHGLWSMFQSVGISHPRYTPLLKRAAHAVSILVAAGYISIPVSVTMGWLI